MLRTLRGLAALTLLAVFTSTLSANYLYKDEITSNQKFHQDIEALGKELYDKTGIAVRVVMIKMLPKGKHIAEYEKEIVSKFNEPTVLLTFSAEDQKVDILAKPHSLYQLFDKKQILSPVASYVQSAFMALFFTHSWKEFKETLTDYGGSIIPILAQKTKKQEDTINKYTTAIFNGYADLVGQIAKAKGVELSHDVGSANQQVMTLLKVLFYGFILYAIFAYIRLRIKQRGKKQDA